MKVSQTCKTNAYLNAGAYDGPILLPAQPFLGAEVLARSVLAMGQNFGD